MRHSGWLQLFVCDGLGNLQTIWVRACDVVPLKFLQKLRVQHSVKSLALIEKAGKCLLSFVKGGRDLMYNPCQLEHRVIIAPVSRLHLRDDILCVRVESTADKALKDFCSAA